MVQISVKSTHKVLGRKIFTFLISRRQHSKFFLEALSKVDRTIYSNHKRDLGYIIFSILLKLSGFSNPYLRYTLVDIFSGIAFHFVMMGDLIIFMFYS